MISHNKNAQWTSDAIVINETNNFTLFLVGDEILCYLYVQEPSEYGYILNPTAHC